jgi:hypothetical protein
MLEVKVRTNPALKMVLSNIEGLPPIKAILEDHSESEGEILILCGDKSWSYFWGSLSGRGVKEFFLSCDVGYYLLKCFWDHSKKMSEPDYEFLTQLIQKEVLDQRRCESLSKVAARAFYDVKDWSEFCPNYYSTGWIYPLNQNNKELRTEFEIFAINRLYDIDVPSKFTRECEHLVEILEAVQSGLSTLNNEDVE